MENTKTRYKVFAGLGGGFGGSKFKYVDEYANEDEAMEAACQTACEEYESYEGLHGLETEYDFRLEVALEKFGVDDEDELPSSWDDELSEEDAESATARYKDDVESWICYYVEECTGDCFNCDDTCDCEQQNEYGNECTPEEGDCNDCDNKCNCVWKK